MVEQDVFMFDLCHAANLASYRERNKLIKAYMETGNHEQRRLILKLCLSKATILDDTKSIIRDVILDNETVVAIQLLKTIKTILSKIFQCRKGRISNPNSRT